jgi:hypothetical protein
MQINSNILKELEELAPNLSGLTQTNVFKVPDDYFETLSSELLVKTTASAASYAVPNGYFDQLSDQILSKLKHSEQDSSVVAATDTLSPTIAGIGNKNVFSVPNSYFDNISHHADVYAETAAIATTVADIGKVVTYTVPQGYFERLTNSILNKKDTGAKVVAIKSSPMAWRYAVAAAITVVTAISVWFVFNNNATPNTNTITAAVEQEAKQILLSNSFDQELLTVSDAAIVEFLESKGQNIEAALVASYTDVVPYNKLPDATDYILNEDVLDELLETLQLND